MNAEVKNYLASIDRDSRRQDCQRLVKIMAEESGYQARLAGSMVCFGSYHYKYASGHEGDAMVTGFASRSQNISIYIMPGFSGFADELARLGKHKTAKSCLYIKSLSEIDEKILRRIIRASVKIMQQRYACQPEPPQT
jgi:hypothetical protein